MRLAAIAAGLCLSGACFAQTLTAAPARFETRIEPQPLASALKQFAACDHVQVLYMTADVRDLRSLGASGLLTVDETLTNLLRGTGLSYRYIDARAITVIAGTRKIGPTGNGNIKTQGRGEEALSDDTSHKHAPVSIPNLPDPPLTRQPHTMGDAGGALGEVIVTAQKYRQRAFDVPISLEVIDGEQLARQGVTNLSNLQYVVPGLHMDSTGYTHGVYLRGVGNYQGSGAMVGQYINEADISTEGTFNTFAEGDNGLYDLNRVEVLKGPQGTLYGDGSMGGVIRYITNTPILDRLQMNADVTAVLTQSGAPSQRIETMLNTPLVVGKLGLRFAAMLEHDGGWVAEPAASLKSINGSNLADARVEARWQPTERLNVDAMQIVHRHTYGLGSGEDAGGNFTPLFDTTLTPNGSDVSNLSNLTLTYDFDSVQLLNSATYMTDKEVTYNQFVSETVGPETLWILIPYFSVSNRDYSDEFRLVHTGRGPWQWTVGGFYKHFSDVPIEGQEIFGPLGSTLSSAERIPVPTKQGSSSEEAGFVNTSYELFERFTLGAGARYSEDRETVVAPGQPLSAGTFTSTDPRFYVQYLMTRHINIYSSAAKGFRSGGFNVPPAPPYQPETLWSYEFGSKFRFPREGLRANVDFFYMNYSNFVTSSYIPPVHLLSNAGRARIRGVDADATWQPIDRWRIGLNTELLKTEFLTTTSISGYVPGDRLPFAPAYSFTTSVLREFPWKGRPAYLGIYYYQIGRTQYRLLGFPLSQSDILRFLSARLGIQWSERLELELFAQNLLNDRGNESVLNDFLESTRPRPRTIGIEFKASIQ